jgi:hypothetical protein
MPRRGRTLPANVPLCQTIDEDEVTQCTRKATRGAGEPPIFRCVKHDKEYRKLAEAYHASKIRAQLVYETGSIPKKAEILGYNDHRTCLDKLEEAQRYLDAIREERCIREILYNRHFFLNSVFLKSFSNTPPFMLIRDSS